MSYCSPVRLEFHGGVALGTTVGSPLVLVDVDEELMGGVPLPVVLEQLVQGVDFLGGDSPANWTRGNRRTRMEFAVWRSSVSAAAALKDGLDDALTLPVSDGWIRVTLDGLGDTWAIADVAVQAVAASYPDEEIGRAVNYVLQAGALMRTADIPVVSEPDYSVLTEAGDFLTVEYGGGHVLLEEAL